jgi:hypothetical protein
VEYAGLYPGGACPPGQAVTGTSGKAGRRAPRTLAGAVWLAGY